MPTKRRTERQLRARGRNQAAAILDRLLQRGRIALFAISHRDVVAVTRSTVGLGPELLRSRVCTPADHVVARGMEIDQTAIVRGLREACFRHGEVEGVKGGPAEVQGRQRDLLLA